MPIEFGGVVLWKWNSEIQRHCTKMEMSLHEINLIAGNPLINLGCLEL
jgi:hypothetical protein